VSASKPQSYSAAVIGCGRIGSGQDLQSPSLGIYSHCEAFRFCERTDLVAVCDPNADALEKCQNRWNSPMAFTSVEDLLATSNPEIVSICAPDREHARVARLVLEAPSTRCVILEKPLAATLQEALEIVEIADRMAENSLARLRALDHGLSFFLRPLRSLPPPLHRRDCF
jgi:predicted dehydrogenase